MSEPDQYTQGCVRAIIAGGVWLAPALHHAGLRASRVCPHCDCGEEETHRHLYWECEAWAHIRHKHPEADILAHRPGLPECTVAHGLVLEDPELLEHEKYLLDIEDAIPDQITHPPPDAIITQWKAYTDGACSNNQTPKLRRGGYGVWFEPQAPSRKPYGPWLPGTSPGHLLADPRNVSCALPGLVQTNNRGELTAAIHAARLGALHILTDSQYVMKGVHRIRNGYSFHKMQNNDLWDIMRSTLQQRT